MASALLAEPAEGVEQRHPLLVQGLSSALSTYLSLDPISSRLAQLEGFWASPEAPACPQLFLYSETDALVPPEAVRAFMEGQARRGVAVAGRCWPTSGHVEHLRWAAGARGGAAGWWRRPGSRAAGADKPPLHPATGGVCGMLLARCWAAGPRAVHGLAPARPLSAAAPRAGRPQVLPVRVPGGAGALQGRSAGSAAGGGCGVTAGPAWRPQRVAGV